MEDREDRERQAAQDALAARVRDYTGRIGRGRIALDTSEGAGYGTDNTSARDRAERNAR